MGRKREKEEKKKMEASQHSGERMLVCLYVEQLPLCWHSITSLKNVSNQHHIQHWLLTCKYPQESEVSNI